MQRKKQSLARDKPAGGRSKRTCARKVQVSLKQQFFYIFFTNLHCACGQFEAPFQRELRLRAEFGAGFQRSLRRLSTEFKAAFSGVWGGFHRGLRQLSAGFEVAFSGVWGGSFSGVWGGLQRGLRRLPAEFEEAAFSGVWGWGFFRCGFFGGVWGCGFFSGGLGVRLFQRSLRRLLPLTEIY